MELSQYAKVCGVCDRGGCRPYHVLKPRCRGPTRVKRHECNEVVYIIVSAGLVELVQSYISAIRRIM